MRTRKRRRMSVGRYCVMIDTMALGHDRMNRTMSPNSVV
jgi:hypothetical protein